MERLENRRLLAGDLLFTDSFETGGGTGGWAGNWAEDSQDDWNRTSQRSFDGSYAAEVDGNADDAALMLANPLDLSSYTDVELTFSWYIESGFDNGEYLSLQLGDGGGWTEVARIDGTSGWWAGPNENQWRTETIAIDPGYLTADFNLRFLANVSSSSEDGFVDNVQITGTLAGPPDISISDAVLKEEGASDVLVPTGLGGIDNPKGMFLHDDGLLYVVSNRTTEVVRFDSTTGAFVDVFVSSGNGGLHNAIDVLFTPDGDLLVSSRSTNEVLRYDGTNGAFLGPFVTAGSGGIDGNGDLEYGPDGNLYVSGFNSDTVLRYDGATGAFLDVFVGDDPATALIDESGGLEAPAGLMFDSTGNAYLASFGSDQVLKYNSDGDFLGEFIGFDNGLEGPGNMVVGPDGDLYLTAFKSDRVMKYDLTTGAYIGDVINDPRTLRYPRTPLFDTVGNLIVSGTGNDNIIRLATGPQVTLSHASVDSITVDYVISDGSASRPGDYVGSSGTLTFAPGEVVKRVPVTAVDDTVVEGQETLTVTLANANGGAVIVDSHSDVIILDDDSGRQVVVSDAAATEGASNLVLVDRPISDAEDSLTYRNLLIGPDGNGDGEDDFYVVSSTNNRVLRFDGVTGLPIDNFIMKGESTLKDPVDLRFGPDGDVYVTTGGTNANPGENKVLKFDGETGVFLRDFATGLQGAISFDFGDNGDMFVANRDTNAIERFDGATGISQGDFITAAAGSDGDLRQVIFGQDLTGDSFRDLYVVSEDTTAILRYDASNGSLIDTIDVPDSYAELMWIDVGRDGSIYAAVRPAAMDARVLKIDGDTGAVLDEVPLARDGWSLFVDDNDVVYVGGNAAGGIVDRIAPASNAAFTVSLSTSSAVPVSVDFNTSDGSASAAVDFQATAGTITFRPGETSKSIIVPTTDDLDAEADETFEVTLSTPVGTTILDATGVGTIIDDDASRQITISDATATEGGTAWAFADEFDVNSGSATQTKAWDTAYDDGYVFASLVRSDGVSGVSRLNVETGELDLEFVPLGTSGLYRAREIAVRGNWLYVANKIDPEVLRFDTTTGLPDPNGAFIAAGDNGLASARGLAFDSSGNLFVGSKDTNQIFKYNSSGIFQGVFASSVSNDTAGVRDLAIDSSGDIYAAVDNRVAKFRGTDGTPLGDAVLPGSGGLQVVITIDIGPDGDLYVADGDGTTGLLRFDGQSGAFAGPVAQSTIGQLHGPTFDSSGSFYAADHTNIIRYAQTSNAIVAVTLSSPSQNPVTVDFTTADGSATAGLDYQASNGILTFQPGETNKSIIVPTTDDSDAEADETFEVTLSNPVGATILDGTGVGTIIDDGDPANQSPVADNDSYAVAEDAVLNVAAPGVLDGDTDPEGDPLTAVLATQASNGVVALNTDGSFTYTPDPDFNGSDSFTYMANDGTSDSNVATVNLTITAVNDDPIADAQSIAAKENTSKAITLSGGDVDGDPLSFTVLIGPDSGILSGTVPNLTYTPNLGFTGTDSFTFIANDGTVDSPAATVTINVAENNAPIADPQAVGVDEDDSVVILLTGSDPDADPISFEVMDHPVSGSLTGAVPNLTYTPGADFNGLDSFTFKVNDGTDDSDVVTVALTVNPVNDTPTADAQSIGTAEDTPLPITLTGSDIDGDSLSYIVTAGPTSGVLTGTGANRTYTPDANFNGSDSLTFQVNDGQANSSTVIVSIDVSAINDAPNAIADAYSIDQDTMLSVAASGVLGNDSDVDGDSLTASLVSTTANGVLTFPGDGSFDYTPNPGFVGSDSFTYSADDGTVGGNTVTVSLTVDAVASGPNLAHGVAATVDSSWQTVVLPSSYTSMVVVATPNYDSGSAPAVVRIQNAQGNSFEIRVDAAGPTEVGNIDVHYVVMEEGVYDEPGYKLEAVKYNSTVTDENNSWAGEARSYQQSYSNPVVIGQVMSYNDSDWSVFWSRGSSRTAIPNSSSLYVGKNVGEDPDNSRADETIGYFVIETSTSGTAEIEGLPYVAAVGGDSIKGVDDSPAYSYSYSAMPNSRTAVASQAAMDGGNGGWAVLYGDDPITPKGSTLNLAIDEDQFNDSERKHTTEQVAYFIIDPPLGKSVDTTASIMAPVPTTKQSVTMDVELKHEDSTRLTPENRSTKRYISSFDQAFGRRHVTSETTASDRNEATDAAMADPEILSALIEDAIDNIAF